MMNRTIFIVILIIPLLIPVTGSGYEIKKDIAGEVVWVSLPMDGWVIVIMEDDFRQLWRFSCYTVREECPHVGMRIRLFVRILEDGTVRPLFWTQEQ